MRSTNNRLPRSAPKYKTFTPEQLARKFARQRQEIKDARAKKQLGLALKKFRPRKGERGKIVFIGRDGSRLASTKGRTGYAVYVDKKGKRTPIRQFDRKQLKVERVPQSRRISEIDVSRVRSKRAKKAFLESHTNEIARGQTFEKSRYGFRRNFRRIDVESDFAEFAAKELLRILRSQRSTDRNLALQIGVTAQTPAGTEFFETSIDALPGDLRKAKIESISVDRLREFFGRQVYAFIASEMAARGYVMAGSANYVRNLPENKNRKRDKWTKGGHHWQGSDKTEIKVKSVEWRFLQLTFTKA